MKTLHRFRLNMSAAKSDGVIMVLKMQVKHFDASGKLKVSTVIDRVKHVDTIRGLKVI